MREIASFIIPALAGLAFVCIPYQWCRRRGERPESYGIDWTLPHRHLVECAIVTAAFLLPLTFVSINWPFEELPRHSGLWRTLNIGLSGLGAAVIEEIFFRGWIYPLFRKKFGTITSIIATSVIFALAHIFVAQTPFLFAVFIPGCVMGALRARHGNIATSTLFHAAGNIWAIWLAPLTWPSLDWIVQRLF